MRKGVQTSEFWLSAAASLLSLLFASGLLVEGSVAFKVAALAASVLTALGYAVVRGGVKKAEQLRMASEAHSVATMEAKKADPPEA